MRTCASSASSSGAASPIGDAVARLPPSVARLRISGEANSASHSRTTAGACGPALFDFGERQPGADLDSRPRIAENSRSSGMPSTLTSMRPAPAAQIRFHARDRWRRRSTRASGWRVQQRKALGERCGALEALPAPGCRERGRAAERACAAGRRNRRRAEVAERQRRIAQRTVAGAAAEIAAHRVRIAGPLRPGR